MSLLDEVMPQWDVRELHTVAVDAAPERMLEAAVAVRVRDLPVVRLLFLVRGLSRGGDDATFVGAMLRAGFLVVAEEPGRELGLGGVGKPLNVLARLRRDVDVRTFAEPGWARVAMTVRADDGVLTTETRVACTDERARRRFRLYWLVVAPFSGLTRRLLLRAAKRAAERV